MKNQFEKGNYVLYEGRVRKIIDEKVFQYSFKDDNDRLIFKPFFEGHKFKLSIQNSPLNKKLYPTYKEYKGFLIPEKIATKIKQGDSCKK